MHTGPSKIAGRERCCGRWLAGTTPPRWRWLEGFATSVLLRFSSRARTREQASLGGSRYQLRRLPLHTDAMRLPDERLHGFFRESVNVRMYYSSHRLQLKVWLFCPASHGPADDARAPDARLFRYEKAKTRGDRQGGAIRERPRRAHTAGSLSIWRGTETRAISSTRAAEKKATTHYPGTLSPAGRRKMLLGKGFTALKTSQGADRCADNAWRSRAKYTLFSLLSRCSTDFAR